MTEPKPDDNYIVGTDVPWPQPPDKALTLGERVYLVEQDVELLKQGLRSICERLARLEQHARAMYGWEGSDESSQSEV